MYYYQLQTPGHVNALLDLSGNVVNHYRYTPFGTPANGFPVEGTPNPLRYMARALDAATGLYYVRNRWYDPQVGRFVSEDPIGLLGGINLYEYAAGNPVMFRDPTGLCHDGGAYLTSGYSTGRMPEYWEFTHNGQQYHGHGDGGYYFLLCAPGTLHRSQDGVGVECIRAEEGAVGVGVGEYLFLARPNGRSARLMQQIWLFPELGTRFSSQVAGLQLPARVPTSPGALGIRRYRAARFGRAVEEFSGNPSSKFREEQLCLGMEPATQSVAGPSDLQMMRIVPSAWEMLAGIHCCP
jgi:RHS repeat-associated protein